MVYTVTESKKTESVGGSVMLEILFAFCVSLPFFTLGVETSLGEPFEDDFETSNTTIWLWYQAARLVAAAASAPIFAFISQKFGRKAVYFCISLVQGLVFIPVFIGTHESPPYTYILIGISSGGLFTLLPYIREITFKTRGFSLTMTMVMTMTGYQLRVLVWEYYDPLTFLLLGLVAVQLFLVLCVVESPSYLVMVGKNENAKAVLSTLKRMPENDPLIMKEIDTISDEIARGTAGKTTLISLYRNKICWDSIKMGVLLFTTMELCGSLVFQDAKNACDCGIGLRDPIIIVAFMLTGSVLTMITVTFCERKYILTFGYITMAISLGVYAVFSQINPNSEAHNSASLTTGLFLPVALVANGMASGLPAIVVVELFNVKICTPILAALFTYSQLLKLLHIHTFQYLEEYVGIHPMFYIFAGINLYGGVYALFVVPKIRNKSLKQIEKQVKRIPLPA